MRLTRIALTLLASLHGLSAEPAGGAREVTLDVKESDVREVLGSVRDQCGIRNLVIDPEVAGKATLIFRKVPCNVAIRTILRMLDLEGEMEENSVLHVRRRR